MIESYREEKLFEMQRYLLSKIFSQDPGEPLDTYDYLLEFERDTGIRISEAQHKEWQKLIRTSERNKRINVFFHWTSVIVVAALIGITFGLVIVTILEKQS